MSAELDKDEDNTYVRMYYREGHNVREIQWSGFGFQVWMQMMTHIMRATNDSTLILDEPDIYLHPDLQHKLLNILQERVGQSFIATHSSEIINEVDPGDVLSISGDRQTAKRVRSEKDYSEVFALLGSSENAEFSRLARARRVLFFEGKDKKIFRKVAERVGKLDVVGDTQTAYLETEGFGQWERVKNAAWLVDQLFSIDVKVAAIFDRDYRSDEKVENFLSSMRERNLVCWVLPVKETENLLLSYPAIRRIVIKEVGVEHFKKIRSRVDAILDECENEFKDEVRANRIGEFIKFALDRRKGTDPGTLAKIAPREFEDLWADPTTRLTVVPGKQLLARIFGRVKEEFNVSLSHPRIANEMSPDEFHTEIRRMLNELEAFFVSP